MKEQRMQDALRRFKAGIFQGLAHPTRIAIVELLSHGELPAGKMTLLAKRDLIGAQVFEN